SGAGQSPAPAVAPAPAPWSPNPQPTPAYRFIYRPAPQTSADPGSSSPPAILEIDLTDQVIVTPVELNVRVLASPSVVSVTAQTLGRSITLPEVQPGLFGFSTELQAVPNSLRNRSFDVRFVAADAAGRTAAVTLPLTLK
ncbi:MAG: hypothetical protein WCE83_08230, partial [Candidatus Baltobacteraceae bacterium]